MTRAGARAMAVAKAIAREEARPMAEAMARLGQEIWLRQELGLWQRLML